VKRRGRENYPTLQFLSSFLIERRNDMTYTDAFIDYLVNIDHMDNPYEKEYTPFFLESIEDIQDEMDYSCESWDETDEVADNIIPFPNTTWEPTDPASSALAA
jgi:hypothetical protein